MIDEIIKSLYMKNIMGTSARSVVALFFIVVASAINCFAAKVDTAKAIAVAMGFWNTNIAVVEDARDFRVAALPASYGQANFYVVVRTNGQGFAIIPADDRVRPILAYSPDGTIDTAAIPCNTNTLLRSYSRQIQHCIDKDLPIDNKVKSQWMYYALAANATPTSFDYYSPLYVGEAARGGIGPLMTSEWNQSAPYNDMCPYDSVNGGRSVVGCAATAMSQVMRYWQYPVHGVGSHSYTNDVYSTIGTVYADFANTTYDWGNMPDRCLAGSTVAQKQSVATLCFHCGVAIEMGYSRNSSGAQICNYGIPNYPSIETALKEYFRYSPALHYVSRDDSGLSETAWNNMLKNELLAGRPVLYAGYDYDSIVGVNSGHAFVCDGLDNTIGIGSEMFFHFNWGWGGLYDGYFTTDYLVPAGGGIGTNATNNFSYGQIVLVGVEPDSMAMKVIPGDIQMSARADSAVLTIKMATGMSAWTATASSPWMHLSATSGTSSNALATITLSVDSNPGLTRSGYIMVRQGSSVQTVNVLQNRAQYSPAGYYGFATTNNYIRFGGDYEVLMRADQFGDYAIGDTVSHVFFFTCSDPTYSNTNFKISIYENPTYATQLAQGESVPVSAVLPSAVCSQNSFQQNFGMHEVKLNTPYVIGPNPFWIGLKMRGATVLYFDYHWLPMPVAEQDYPLLDSVKNLYLYRDCYNDTVYSALRKLYAGSDMYQAEMRFCVGFRLSPRMDQRVVVDAVSSDENRGTVVGGGPYYYGDLVTLHALPKPGFHFVSWNDGNHDNPRTFTLATSMVPPLRYVASFQTGVDIQQTESQDVGVAVRGRSIFVDCPENATLRLFDVLGRMLYSVSNTGQTTKFDVPSKGVYLLKVGNDKARKVLVAE